MPENVIVATECLKLTQSDEIFCNKKKRLGKFKLIDTPINRQKSVALVVGD